MASLVDRLSRLQPPSSSTLIGVVLIGSPMFVLFLDLAPVLAGAGLASACVATIALSAIHGAAGLRSLWQVEGRTWVWGRRRFRPADALVVAAFAVAGLICGDLWLSLVASQHWSVGPTHSVDTITSTINGGGWQAVRQVVAVMVAAPLVEEALYRGVLLHAMLRSRMPVVVAVVLSSAVFAVAHSTYGSVQQVTVFILGCAAATATLWCRSFLAGVVVHGVWNASFVLTAAHLF